MKPNFHEYKTTVKFSDVDMGGGLYHPRYLEYLDEARVEFLKFLKVPFGKMLSEGAALVVATANLKYIKPCYFEEELYIYSKVNDINASFGIAAHIAHMLCG